MPCGVALSKRGYNMKRNIKEKAIHYSKIIATEKNFTLFIILTLVLIPLGEIATLVHNEYFVSQPVIVDFAGWVGSIMAVAYFIANRKKYYPSDFFLFTLFVFAVISSTFSHDRNQTLFGFYYDEWFIHYMAYFALMFAATNVKKLKYKEYILAAFVTVTAINIVPSVLESVGAWPYYAYFGAESHEENKWVYGLTQNSNFYAGISTVFTACCTMLFLFAKSKKTCIILFIADLLCFYCSISTGTRISLVGNICFMIFAVILIFLLHRKEKSKSELKCHLKRYGLVLAAFGVIFFILVKFFGRLNGDLETTIGEFENMGSLSAFDSFGSWRGYIWRIGLESVPDFWLTGIGLDNYRDAFEYRADFSTLPWSQGKGHNEYIHILVTEGVFALVNYLALLFYAFFTGMKSALKSINKDRANAVVTCIFLTMFIAYTSQACLNSSVVNTAPYFWVVLGMVMTKNHQRPFGYRKKLKQRQSKS